MYIEKKDPIFTMEVFGERAPTVATGFYMFFAIIFFLVPPVTIGILVNSGEGMKLGFLFLTAAFFSLAYYFFRVASWNYNGVELLQIFEDEVTYQAHTKWLTLATHKLELKGCILVRSDEENGKEHYYLRNNEQVVETRFQAPSSVLNEFENTLESLN